MEIMPDHIHYFVSVPPSYAPSEVMHILKGNTSRQLRLVFPFLKTIIRDSLWADGYYVATVGEKGNWSVVEAYVKNQGTDVSHLRLF